MKKILTISLSNNIFVILCKTENGKTETKNITISKENLILKGEDIFENIFCDVKLGEHLDIEYNVDESVSSDKSSNSNKIIIDNFKSLIDFVKDKINERVQTQDVEM